MKRKEYQEPTMQVVKLQQQCQLLDGSSSSSVNASMDGTFTEEDI